MEKENYHLLIIDVTTEKTICIINIYRSFRPPELIAPSTFFNTQLELIKSSLTDSTYVLGDFNLDAKMDLRRDYAYRNDLLNLNNFALDADLSQIVNFDTWSRVVNGVNKSSLPDHIYVKDCSTVRNLTFKVPTFGDHLFIILEIEMKEFTPKVINVMRKWSSYSKEKLNESLQTDLRKFDTYSCNVQEHWNVIENVILSAIDSTAPEVNVNMSKNAKSENLPNEIRNMLNKRKRLLNFKKQLLVLLVLSLLFIY